MAPIIKVRNIPIIRRGLQAPNGYTTALIANALVNARGWRIIRPRNPPPTSKNCLKVEALLRGHVHAKKDSAFAEFSITASNLYHSLGIRRAPPLASILGLLEELASKAVWLCDKHGSKTGKDGWHRVAWFDKQPRYEAGRIFLQLSDELKPYLLGLEDRYTTQYVQSILALGSVDAIRLYEFLRQFARLWQRSHRVKVRGQLCDVVGFRWDNLWGRFDRDKFRPAIKQIMERTELDISYRPVRMGRTDRKRGAVDEIIIQVHERPDFIAMRQADEAFHATKSKSGLPKLGFIGLRQRLQFDDDCRVLTGVKDVPVKEDYAPFEYEPFENEPDEFQGAFARYSKHKIK